MRQLPSQAPDDEPEWKEAGEDSMYSQDAEYEDDGLSKGSRRWMRGTMYKAIMGHRDQ